MTKCVELFQIRWWSEPDVQNRMIKQVDGSARKAVFDKLKQDTLYFFEVNIVLNKILIVSTLS